MIDKRKSEENSWYPTTILVTWENNHYIILVVYKPVRDGIYRPPGEWQTKKKISKHFVARDFECLELGSTYIGPLNF